MFTILSKSSYLWSVSQCLTDEVCIQFYGERTESALLLPISKFFGPKFALGDNERVVSKRENQEATIIWQEISFHHSQSSWKEEDWWWYGHIIVSPVPNMVSHHHSHNWGHHHQVRSSSSWDNHDHRHHRVMAVRNILMSSQFPHI